MMIVVVMSSLRIRRRSTVIIILVVAIVRMAVGVIIAIVFFLAPIIAVWSIIARQDVVIIPSDILPIVGIATILVVITILLRIV